MASKVIEILSKYPELQGKKIYCFDYESDGLLDSVTKGLCAWVIDAVTGERWGFPESNILGALKKLDEADVLMGHNIIGFDIPMLHKVYGWMPNPGQVILDTLWMSRMYNPDILGGHSLGAWGERLGNPKTEYYPVLDPEQPDYDPLADPKQNPGWDTAIYTKMMDEYCEQDVAVNVDLFVKLLELLQHFSYSSVICEMQCAKVIQRQMEVGFEFDYYEAEMLHAKFMERKNQLEDEVHETFKPMADPVRTVQPKVKLDGTLSSVGLKKLGDDWETLVGTPEFSREVDVLRDSVWNEFTESHETIERTVTTVTYSSGEFTLIEWPEFNLGSRQQIADRLQRKGWKPKSFTEKGNIIVDDSSLADAADLGIPEAILLSEYFLITKREGMVKDWLSRAKKNKSSWRIHGFVNSLGAATNRMTHNSPNVAQVPAGRSPYGAECRGLFTVKRGYTLVGCDASGLELRCLGHYMGDLAYIDTILNGDIHWVNTIALGLIPKGTTRDKSNPEHEAARDLAKTFI